LSTTAPAVRPSGGFPSSDIPYPVLTRTASAPNAGKADIEPAVADDDPTMRIHAELADGAIDEPLARLPAVTRARVARDLAVRVRTIVIGVDVRRLGQISPCAGAPRRRPPPKKPRADPRLVRDHHDGKTGD
jgi:hypothetical protein